MDPAEPRAQYYGAWDAFAADQASRLKDEEAAEAAASERCAQHSFGGVACTPLALPLRRTLSSMHHATASVHVC